MCQAGLLLLSPEPCSLSALTWQSPMGLDTASSYSSFPCPGASSPGMWLPWPPVPTPDLWLKPPTSLVLRPSKPVIDPKFASYPRTRH